MIDLLETFFLVEEKFLAECEGSVCAVWVLGAQG